MVTAFSKTPFVVSLALFMSVFLTMGCHSHNNQRVEDAEVIYIRICKACSTKSQVFSYENKINSNELSLVNNNLRSFSSQIISPGPPTYEYQLNQDAARLFRRSNSALINFMEYAYYTYDPRHFEENPENGKVDYPPIIEFNLGTDPLGFEPKKEGARGRTSFRRTAVRDISLDDFQGGYYSVIKWLYSLETDRYKVKNKPYQHYDQDMYGTPKIEAQDMVLEHPWQEEFLFTLYELVDTKTDLDYDPMAVRIVPYTHAPIGMYEARPDPYAMGPFPYRINIEDMAIRIETYKFLDQFDDGLE
jgi:uncharacterized protein YcfL